ncbi:MAG: hypothetical protein WAX69_11160 [Victivallales bacterium]
MQDLIHFNTSICSAVFAVFIFLAASFSIGSLLPSNSLSPSGKIIIRLIIGMDILTVLGYFLGCFGLLSNVIVIISLSSATAILAISLFRKTVSYPKPRKCSCFKHCIPLVLPLAMLPIMLGRSLCIPTGWDELTYQLEVPARWIQSGHIAIFPDNPYSAFPSAASVNFYILMLAGGILAPRILILAIWGICLVSMYLLIRPGLSKINTSILTFGFGSSFAVVMAATSAYVELFILLQVAGILLLSRNFTNLKTMPYLLGLAGFMAGMAGSVKLTGLVIGTGFLLYILISREGLIKIKLKALFAYFVVFFIILAIFYIRPYLLAGNPSYPYFASFFSSNESTIEMSRYHHLIGSVKYGIQGISALFTDPILLAFSGSTFDGNFGWQFLIILLACAYSTAIAYKSRNNRIAGLLIAALTLYVFWFFTSQQARFIIPAVFLLFIASKHAFRQLPSKVAESLIILTLILSIFSIPQNIMKDCYLSWKTVLGMINPQDYLYSSTGPGYLKAVFVVNKTLPANAKLMMIFENRGLYMDKKHVIGTPFFQEEFFTPAEKIPAPPPDNGNPA